MPSGSPGGSPVAVRTRRILFKRPRCEPSRTFAGSAAETRAWVLTIVRNTSYSWLAKNRPKALVLSEDLDQRARERIEQVATDEPQTPETALIAKLEAQQVRKAMASLPVPFREVLVLREIHDLDYRTIAEVAALPIGTVMSRLARARRLLAAAITADAP